MTNEQFLEDLRRNHERFSRELKGVQEGKQSDGTPYDFTPLYRWFWDLSLEYERHDGDTRRKARESFNDDRLRSNMVIYPGVLATQVKEPADETKARVGLVSDAILDLREDPRDIQHEFEKLCNAAKKAGIPIAGLLRQVLPLLNPSNERILEFFQGYIRRLS